MPACIYCKATRPSSEFANEHVFSRAFCGQGTNWTLVDQVCKSCNGIFSECETHWAHSAAEAMMRAFSGPAGRSQAKKSTRQTLEVANLFLMYRGDSIAYEAGLAYPPAHYLRPQIIEYPPSHISVCSDQTTGNAFGTAIQGFLASKEVFISLHARRDALQKFEITRLVLTPKGKWEVRETSNADKAQGVWLRTLAQNQIIESHSFGTSHQVTRRLVLDDRGRLYARAASPADFAEFLNLVTSTQPANSPTRSMDPKDEELKIGISIKLPMVFRCVLKTGFNLLSHVKGHAFVAESAFDEVRIALIGAGGDDVVMRHCRFLDAITPGNDDLVDFAPDGSIDHHEMVLDNYKGMLRIRLRLYGSTAYVGHLGMLPATIANGLQPIRAKVDFAGAGIQLV